MEYTDDRQVAEKGGSEHVNFFKDIEEGVSKYSACLILIPYICISSLFLHNGTTNLLWGII